MVTSVGNATTVVTNANLTGNVTSVGNATTIASGVVTSDMIADGTIVNGDINASAAIVDTKLATISTGGKVSNSATTATSANTVSAIVARDASGNFSAGTITADLSGTASNVTTNANLTGVVTSVGNATSIANGAITNAMLANSAVANLSGTNTGDQTLASLGAQAQLNGTGFVKATGTTISYDNSTYLTGNQTITLSGDVTGTGTTAITTTIDALKVTNAMLAGSINYSKMDAATVPTWNQNTTGTAANVTTNANLTGMVTSVGNATTVVTNANLTGVVTSVGNATSIANGAITNAMLANSAVANLTGTNSGDQTNITGYSTAVVATVTGTNSTELVRGNMADNDQFRILVGGTATNAGYAEIATADDGTEPIYVRQYTGVFSTLTRTATLLDGSGNTSFPGTIGASNFSGTHSGTSSGTNTGDQTNISGTAGSETLATVTGRGATTNTAVIINNNLAVNTNSPYDTSQFSLDVNGGLLIKNTSKTATLTLINANPATAVNAGFVQWTAGGTTTGAFAALQTYYGASIVGGTLRLQPNGARVGIGVTSASYALDVSGSIRATDDIIAYSDSRVKENVNTITDALTKVISLRGVTYTRIDSKDKSRKIGVIAQEVLPILPEVVQQDDNGNYSVAYGNMVGVLIEAIKEQQQQINELKALLQNK